MPRVPVCMVLRYERGNGCENATRSPVKRSNSTSLDTSLLDGLHIHTTFVHEFALDSRNTYTATHSTGVRIRLPFANNLSNHLLRILQHFFELCDIFLFRPNSTMNHYTSFFSSAYSPSYLQKYAAIDIFVPKHKKHATYEPIYAR
jgi:hypothetical protein